MKRLIMVILGLAALVHVNGCAPKEIVRLDLTSLNENSKAYEDKRVIITTDIASLVNNPAPYYSKDIEISGFIQKYPIGFDWGFYLADETGLSVKCYERKYRYAPWIWADVAVRRAKGEKEKITVVGAFQKNFGIELDWIEYGGEIIDTDYKPDVPRFPLWW